MHIYCAGPIRGDRSYSSYYRDVIRLVSELGHVPLAELNLQPEVILTTEDEGIYLRDMGWLHQAHAMIAEVSAPSLGVGYEIAYALHAREIPVLCLMHCSAENLSAMITGNLEELLTTETYESIEEMEEKIRKFLKDFVSGNQRKA